MKKNFFVTTYFVAIFLNIKNYSRNGTDIVIIFNKDFVNKLMFYVLIC